MEYSKAGGWIPGLVYVTAALAYQILRVYTDLWLSRWTDQSVHSTSSSEEQEVRKRSRQFNEFHDDRKIIDVTLRHRPELALGEDQFCNKLSVSFFQTVSYFKVYIIISLGSILLSFLYNVAGQWAGARARRRLHQEAVIGLLDAPISFFDSNPTGKILNRFSADMGVIDKVKVSPTIVN
jgi:ABC-type multidrug transport system fused ATPase/permease subunit